MIVNDDEDFYFSDGASLPFFQRGHFVFVLFFVFHFRFLLPFPVYQLNFFFCCSFNIKNNAACIVLNNSYEKKLLLRLFYV